MPKAAPKPCHKHPKILVNFNKPCGKCIEINRAAERKRRKNKGPRPYDKASWKRLRKAFLANEPFCRKHKARGELIRATDVDHINGDEWDWNIINLQSLCHECHAEKTVLENGGFGFESN